MTLTFAILAIILASVAVIASFVSAPSYSYIFATIFICEIFAIACLVPLIRLGKRWNYVVTAIVIVILYTVSDVCLRIFFGVRVLDIVR